MTMVDIIIEDLKGFQANYLIKLADMMKAAEVTKNKIEKPYPGGEPIQIGILHVNNVQFDNCVKIEKIIDSDPLY